MSNNVRNTRHLRGWTIEELRRRSGVSHGHISEIENGKKHPGIAVAQRLARALDTDVDELFPEGGW